MIGGCNNKDCNSKEERRKLMKENVRAIEERGRILAEKRQKMRERRRTLDQDFLNMELRNQMLEESRQSLLMSINIDNSESFIQSKEFSSSLQTCYSMATIVNLKNEDKDRNVFDIVRNGDGKDCALKLRKDSTLDKGTSIDSSRQQNYQGLETFKKCENVDCDILPNTSASAWKRVSILKDKLNQKKKELAHRRTSKLLNKV
ncbi:Hypothetical protein SRAE_1000014600 [Strongyloides ratti]|uniref:Uncharacterized protein n=1 Tax=Strongyloides ratti TaxID=34506 RepID=A0A090KWI0_STRRB|nr:Hypothetical protein SRAE_1000014600 [Strongyloides ratti]CEF61870.1 Hypothetical protein SRAE_1000014600 [Strongyloides ratti]